jgi:hypothetical protein
MVTFADFSSVIGRTESNAYEGFSSYFSTPGNSVSIQKSMPSFVGMQKIHSVRPIHENISDCSGVFPESMPILRMKRFGLSLQIPTRRMRSKTNTNFSYKGWVAHRYILKGRVSNVIYTCC